MTAALRNARIPSAAHVWWRSQIRVRQEAVRTVSRPMTVVQGIGAAAAVGLAAGAVSMGWQATRASETDLVTLASGLADQILSVTTITTSQATLVLAAVVVCLVLMPVAVYFALSDPKA
jgi:hypothetical protein